MHRVLAGGQHSPTLRRYRGRPHTRLPPSGSFLLSDPDDNDRSLSAEEKKNAFNCQILQTVTLSFTLQTFAVIGDIVLIECCDDSNHFGSPWVISTSTHEGIG